MRPIRDEPIAEPGLVVVDVAAADDPTAFALQEALASRWATATADRTAWAPDEPGIRLRCYRDLHKEVTDVVVPAVDAAASRPDS